MIFDETDPERTSRTLADLQGRLRLLSAHTQGIIFELNAEARFVRVWTSDERLLARPESELVGRTIIEALGPELGAWHDEKVRRALKTGVGEEYEYTLDVPSGRRVFAASSVAVPALDRDERAVIFWIRDITEQVHLRTKLLQTERLASVGMLAAGVAHEINNPLGYILLSLGHVGAVLEALRRPGRNPVIEEACTSLEMVRQGVERVRKIVDDLRSFSRADYIPCPVDVHRALEFSIEATAAEVRNRAVIVRDFGDPPLVNASEAQLGQIFINLLANAAQAIPEGHPHENEIQLVTRRDEKGRAVVEIRDTGIGVPEGILDRIFDPFFTTKESGSGLGLPICHSIVTSLGGEIRVERGHPRGTVLRVVLPPPELASAEELDRRIT